MIKTWQQFFFISAIALWITEAYTDKTIHYLLYEPPVKATIYVYIYKILNYIKKRRLTCCLQKDRHAIFFISRCVNTLQWRHNEHDSVSNHQPHDCLLNCLFRRGSKKTSKLRVTGLCEGNSPGTDEFPAQMASCAENVSIWWRHHDETVYFLILWFICDWIKGHDRVKRRYNAVQYNTISHTALRWHRTVHNTYNI